MTRPFTSGGASPLPPPKLRAALPLLAPLAALAATPSCGAAPAPPAPPASSARPEAPPRLGPPRWLIGHLRAAESTPDGIDRLVTSGRRLELRGAEIVGQGPPEPDLDGGARAPAWAQGAPGAAATRWVFWKGKQLWGADTFLGPLRSLGTLRQEPRGTFDWIDGVGLLLPGGALAVPAAAAVGSARSPAPLRPLGVPAPVHALAASPRLGVVVTALGHAFVTTDGGASYRDASRDLGGATSLSALDGAVVAALPTGVERVVTAAGAVVDRDAFHPAPASSPAPSRPDPDPFFDATHVRPLAAAARAGLPLPDGGVVIAEHGFVGRFDPATLRATSVAPLDPGLRDATCTPVRAGGVPVLACIGAERAAVVDLAGAPRTERTFDLAGASDLDRFVAGEDALGFLGPCDGTPPRAPDLDQERESWGDPYNASRQQVPVFCVRAGKDDWVEHRLAGGEARDLVAWIPRASGGAVALLSRPGQFLSDRERVEVRGALRLVRLARSEPPLSLGPYSFMRAEGVDDSLRVLADDTITGWLTGSNSGVSDTAITIDPGGRVHARATPPQTHQIVRAGPLALAAGDDGRLWETVDGGRRWREVEPPPTARRSGVTRPHACSAAGCSVGPFVRLGWTTAPDPGPPSPVELPMEKRIVQPRYRRQPLAPPLVRLACSPAGLAEGKRIADSGGLGYTPQPQPRTGILRTGSMGMVFFPHSNGPILPTTGDVDLAWLAPLDPSGALHRRTLSIARLGAAFASLQHHHVGVGYLIAPDGGLSTFATGHGEECASATLDLAGLTRPLGACAPDPSVGVDLGGRIFVVHPSWDGLHVLAADAGPRAAGKRAPSPGGASLPSALHEIHEVRTGGSVRGFTFGAGARGGTAVVVVLDAAGQAALAPIDPEQGTLGPEERLRPLSEAALGSSPACAPRPGEARVVLPFDDAIALDRAALRGVGPASGSGVAVLRWSADRACLDAVELPVHDDRFDENPGPYEPYGVLRKLVARFDGRGQAALVLLGLGTETRQKLTCNALLPGSGEP